MGMIKRLSVVIPVFNEEDNIQLLHQRLHESLSAYMEPYEIIYVDDGSTDATFSRLRQLAAHDTRVCIVQLKRNFGQTIALSAGIEQSTGSILVFMDGDLQNDARDIPRLLAKLDEGYDVVSGWRKQRKDALLSRRLPSWLANRLIACVTGIHIHDFGCSLKAYRREVFAHLRLYGEMHRLLPAYAALTGARITELEVAHHPRRFGSSKYGLSRTIRVLLDLLKLKFEASFATKPIYGLGITGFFWLLLGCLFLLFIPFRKASSRLPGSFFLLCSAIVCVGFSNVFICMGLLAESLMRTYYESQGKPTYAVKALVVPSEKMLSIDEMNPAPTSPFATWRDTQNGRELFVEQEL